MAKNLAQAMRFFGTARKSGEVLEVPGLSLISCGLNYAAFNAAVLSEPVGPQSSELQKHIEVARGHFEFRNLRWTCWLCEDLLSELVRRESRNILDACGLMQLNDSPGMYADHLTRPRRPLPLIQIRKVSDDPTRSAFAYVTSVAFEIPHPICRDIYGSEPAWAGSFEGFVGYVAGVPVSTVGIVVSAGLVGVYSVATLPKFRHCGYAEATMRAALAEVRERTGIETTALQSTPSGYRLYEQMGYRKLTKFTVYIS